MYLTSSNTVHFLLERGLLDPAEVVGQPVAVVEAGRRCRNFKIHLGDQKGIFVKQVRTTENEALVTLAREASFYQFVIGEENLLSLQSILPQILDFDKSRHVLSLNLIPKAETLNELHHRLKRFPVEIGELLGRGLGTYHKESAAAASVWSTGVFPAQLPWLMHLDPSTLAPLNTFPEHVGSTMMSMLVQRPYLMNHLWALGQDYKFDTLVHGDMKWDNFVVYPVEADGAFDFKVVDWELADIGDGVWDVAAVFAAYMLYVLMSAETMANQTDQPPRQDLSLINARPAMRRFWDIYAEYRGMDATTSHTELIRTISYLSGRLVLSVFEGLINSTLTSAQAEKLFDQALAIAINPTQSAAEIVGLEKG